MEIGRPSTKSQPSRKGKKAWRKNIDIDDVDEGLAEAREFERTYGSKPGEFTDDLDKDKDGSMFTVDTAGDSSLKSKKMRNEKPLKATEILARRSATKVLIQKHKKQEVPKAKAKKTVEGVTGKEINRLMKAAGRTGEGSAKAVIESDGVIRGEAYDLWDAPPAEETKSSKKKKLQDFPFLADLKPATSHNKAEVVPKTLKHTPVSLVGEELAKAVVVPEGGKSYNPDIEEWKKLIEKEAEREELREKERQKLEEERKRIEEIMIAFDDKNELSDDNDDEEEEDENEDEDEESNNGQLSVNPPVKVKIKTAAKRNKLKRHEERQKLEADLKAVRQQINDLNRLPKLLAQELKRIQEQQEQRAAGKKSTAQRKRKLGTKVALKEAPLEIKLSDELTDTLRRLKPEGNLIADRFRSLQERGFVEPRMPIAKRRRYQQKVTEKWAYKDFKIGK
ncbi:ribosome biogenesis protein Nop53p [Trichomonascus vanleenenianus]|uniref:Nop53p n=1 Tax=Trichomonascus vanleenenianus TaxID=2268995 RepID=UPI003ECAA830